MTNEFNVIGQRKDDDLHLLVLGDDGQHYDYSLTREQVSPVEPDDRWAIDHRHDETLSSFTPADPDPTMF